MRKRTAAGSGQPRQPGSNGKAAAALAPQMAAVVTPSGKSPAPKARVHPLAEQPLLPEPVEAAIGDSSSPRARASAKNGVQQGRPLPNNQATGARPLAEPASHSMPKAEAHAKPPKQPSAKLAASPKAKIAIKAEAQQQRPQTLQVCHPPCLQQLNMPRQSCSAGQASQHADMVLLRDRSCDRLVHPSSLA